MMPNQFHRTDEETAEINAAIAGWIPEAPAGGVTVYNRTVIIPER
jgi:hypothetical protein